MCAPIAALVSIMQCTHEDNATDMSESLCIRMPKAMYMAAQIYICTRVLKAKHMTVHRNVHKPTEQEPVSSKLRICESKDMNNRAPGKNKRARSKDTGTQSQKNMCKSYAHALTAP